MHIMLQNRNRENQIEFGIIYGGIALLVLFAARFMPVLTFAPSCVFKSLTGVPCPTCGATRSVLHLVQGDFYTSLSMNPLVFLCFVAAIPVFFYSLITLIFGIPRIGVVISDREKNMIRSGTVALVLANWCYLIVSR